MTIALVTTTIAALVALALAFYAMERSAEQQRRRKVRIFTDHRTR